MNIGNVLKDHNLYNSQSKNMRSMEIIGDIVIDPPITDESNFYISYVNEDEVNIFPAKTGVGSSKTYSIKFSTGEVKQANTNVTFDSIDSNKTVQFHGGYFKVEPVTNILRLYDLQMRNIKNYSLNPPNNILFDSIDYTISADCKQITLSFMIDTVPRSYFICVVNENFQLIWNGTTTKSTSGDIRRWLYTSDGFLGVAVGTNYPYIHYIDKNGEIIDKMSIATQNHFDGIAIDTKAILLTKAPSNNLRELLRCEIVDNKINFKETGGMLMINHAGSDYILRRKNKMISFEACYKPNYSAVLLYDKNEGVFIQTDRRAFSRLGDINVSYEKRIAWDLSSNVLFALDMRGLNPGKFTLRRYKFL